MAFSIGSVTANISANVKGLITGVKKAEKSLADFGSKGKRLEDQLKSLERRKELIIDKMKAFELAGRKGTIQYKNLENQLANVGDKIKTQGLRIDEFRSKQDRLDRSTDSLTSRFKRMQDSLANVRLKFGSVSAAADNLGGKSLTGLGKILGGLKNGILGAIPILGGLAAGLTAVAVGGFALATKTAGDFQTQMLKVKAISRATAEEFEMLKKQAKDLGRTTQFSAKQVGEAQQFQAMAGLKVNEIMEATPGILNLAASANLDLGRSSDIATNIMSQFGLQASDMNKIVDTLALTVNTSNQDMEQLADAMNYLGPTAKAMGIKLEEAAAITGIMASNGLQGSLGTRALATSLTRLARPTEAMENAMQKLNLKAFDLNGNFVGVSGVVKQLESKFGKLTQEQQQYYLSTLFGAEAIQEWNILLANGSENLNRYSDELRNSTGAAQNMANTMMSGYQGAILRLQSAWEGLLISLGESGIIDLVAIGFSKMATVLTILGDKIETHFKPKMEAMLESLRQWYNTGGKEAIYNFLSTSWNIFTDSIRWFVDNVWPKLKEALKSFAEYLKSEQFKQDLETVSQMIRDIGNAFNWVYEQTKKAINEVNDFENKMKNAELNPFKGSYWTQEGSILGLIKGRAKGGDVKPGQLYEVGENNKAEMLMINNRQYMIPGNKGEVLNQDQLAKQSTTNKTINVYNYNQGQGPSRFFETYEFAV